MQSATFWIDHKESDSRAIVEFGLVDRKVKMIATLFLRGQVVDLNEVRKCRDRAKQILYENRFVPPDDRPSAA